MEQSALLEKLTILHLVNKLPSHYKAEGSLPSSQKALSAGHETPYLCWTVNFRSVLTCSPPGGMGPSPRPGESSKHPFLICYHQPETGKCSN